MSSQFSDSCVRGSYLDPCQFSSFVWDSGLKEITWHSKQTLLTDGKLWWLLPPSTMGEALGLHLTTLSNVFTFKTTLLNQDKVAVKLGCLEGCSPPGCTQREKKIKDHLVEAKRQRTLTWSMVIPYLLWITTSWFQFSVKYLFSPHFRARGGLRPALSLFSSSLCHF